jgi:4-hydroxy-3-methylbut-2-enyl diphosphate reductase
VISKDDFPALNGKEVLFRAHGEPPETYKLARESNISIIDATCPIVEKLQQRIKNNYKLLPDYQIVIYGKPGHAEIAGLNGNAGNNAIIVQGEEDFEKIDFLKPVSLFSQTTMDAQEYVLIGETIRKRMNERGNFNLEINKSVCRQVSGRAPALRLFAEGLDVIVFVSGANSSNGAYLYGICKTVNERSYFISGVEDIGNKWFVGARTVGVSGATSTPAWLIKEVAEYIQRRY